MQPLRSSESSNGKDELRTAAAMSPANHEWMMSLIAPGRETRCEKIDFGKNGILSEMQSSSIDPRVSGWLELLLKL